MMPYKNFLISLFFLASCSNEVSDNQQNLSALMQPNQNYFISQYECTLSQNNNLNDLEQYIPKLSQLSHPCWAILLGLAATPGE